MAKTFLTEAQKTTLQEVKEVLVNGGDAGETLTEKLLSLSEQGIDIEAALKEEYGIEL